MVLEGGTIFSTKIRFRAGTKRFAIGKKKKEVLELIETTSIEDEDLATDLWCRHFLSRG